MTRVIHIRDVPPGWKKDDQNFVFIGRPSSRSRNHIVNLTP